MLQSLARSTRRPRRRALSLAPRPFASTVRSSTSQTSGLRVGVVGLGAIGSIFFTQLSREALRSGATASPLVRSVEAFVKPHHLAQLVQHPSIALSHPASDDGDVAFATIPLEVKHGDLVAGADDAVRIRTLNSERDGREPPLDVVLVALKAYDSARAMEELQANHAHRFDCDAVIVLLQNGLGALPSEEASTTSSTPVNSWHYVNGVTFVGGRVRSMGQVIVSGLETEPTYFAPVSQATKVSADRSRIVTEKLRILSEALAQSGLRSEVLATSEMQTILWRKLIVNAAINPVAALLNAPNGSVGACEWSRRCVEAVVREAVEIAQREQVDLQATEQEMVEYVLRVAVNTKANVCSTLADLRKGARTEIDAITGQLLHFGHKHGVPTPTNALLFDLVKALEAQQLRAGRDGSS